MHTASGDFQRAMELGNEALAMRRALFGNSTATVAQCLDLVAGLHAVNGNPRAAEPLLIEAAEIYAQVHGVNSVARLMTLANLGRVYYKMGNYTKAEPVLLEWHQLLTTASSPDDDMIARARDCLRQLYEDWEKPGEAAKWQ